MADEQKMLYAPCKYLTAFTNKDVDAILALYAENAEVEDPVGSDRHVGKAAIRAFYEGAMGADVVAEPLGEVRLAGHEVAFPFKVTVPAGNLEMRIIDVFRFNEDGEIVEMRAYWGSANAHALSE